MDKIREEFEKLYRKELTLYEDCSEIDTYAELTVQLRFEGFQKCYKSRDKEISDLKAGAGKKLKRS